MMEAMVLLGYKALQGQLEGLDHLGLLDPSELLVGRASMDRRA